MSALHTSPPAPDAVLVPPNGADGSSEPPGGSLAERLSVMKAAWTSFSVEMDSELKSICAILGDSAVSDAPPEPAAPRWEELPAPRPERGRSPQHAAPSEEERCHVRPEVREEFKESPPKGPLKGATPPHVQKGSRPSDALKGHDRIAALKERLAEKLRCEGERPPTENSRSEAAFVTNEEEQS